MNCDDVAGLLQLHVDGEALPADAALLERHLAACPQCRDALRALEALRAACAAAPYHAAPAGLAARLPARLRADTPQARARSRWLPALAAALAAAIVSAVLTWSLVAPDRGAALAEQVVAAHVRAMMASRPVEIASSDQHAVKPWFGGRVDLAPPVVDLTAQGFPLVGGRIDYLDRRTVAALVYRHRQHLIDLFVTPAEDAAPLAETRQGFNLLRWRAGDFALWAISDLNAADLAAFRRAFEAATMRR